MSFVQNPEEKMKFSEQHLKSLRGMVDTLV